MDDEIEINKGDYKYAFDELESIDDESIPVTRIPTAS